VANRVRLTVVAALALLNVFALGAGVAVAALLPARLALWQVPRVATVRIAAPAAVLTPAVSAGSLPTSQGLTGGATPAAPGGAAPVSSTTGAKSSPTAPAIARVTP